MHSQQTVPNVFCRISLWVAALLFNYFQADFFFSIAAVVLCLSCIRKVMGLNPRGVCQFDLHVVPVLKYPFL